jgi:hypothetical protein
MTNGEASILIESTLGQLADIEWAKARLSLASPSNAIPPIVIWRYTTPTSRLLKCIADSIERFRGTLVWRVQPWGRNWVIACDSYLEYLLSSKLTAETQCATAYARNHADESRQANAELGDLLQFVASDCQKGD